MGRKLKELGARHLAAAVSLAKHCRDRKQPEEAESICRDILRVNPEEADALRTLGLALTDRFPIAWMTLFEEACSVFSKLSSEYERVYYTAIAWECYAKAQLEADRAQNAIHAFEEAMQGFEEAERLSVADDPAPILHYNRCLRALAAHPEYARIAKEPPSPEYDFDG